MSSSYYLFTAQRMAAKSAHSNPNQQPNPSIFEVVAAESLNSNFYPAFKRVVTFLATRDPVKFGWLVRYYDEVFLLCNALLQQYYIKTHGGSLAEVFYGLTRCSTKHSAAYTKLVSFITIAILPYILLKCQQIVSKWREEILDNSAGARRREKQTAVTVFQYTSGVYELTKFFQYLHFLTQSTASYTPLMAVLGMGVTFLEQQDEPEWTWRDLVGGKLKTASLLSGFLFRGLELSAFFLQFVQWWTTEAHQGDIASLPLPPPPDSHPDAEKYRGICPICLQKWAIPTTVAVSGYVYCYKCVLIHVEKYGRCKVTNYPVTIDDLIRVYDDEA